MNTTSIDKVKKLLKNSQDAIENGLIKQLKIYDDIKDVKKRREAKKTFLLSYRSMFLGGIDSALKEVCRNKRLEAKIKESEMGVSDLAKKCGLSEEHILAAIEGIMETSAYRKFRIAKELGCKVEEIFD